MLSRLDNWLCDRTQGATNQFQRLIGKTNFWLAKMFFIAALIQVVPLGVFLGSRDGWFVYVVTFFICLNYWIRIIEAGTEDRRSLNGQGLGCGATMNERRIKTKDRFNRIYTAVIFVFVASVALLVPRGERTLNVLSVFWLGADLCALYFHSCTPLPPSKSKARQWYEKLLIKIDEALTPSPEPVPIRAGR